MAKLVARNASLYIEDSSGACQSVSGDTNSVTLSTTAEVPEVTGFGDNTRQRLSQGLLDWELSISGFTNYAAATIDAVIRPVLGGSTYIQFGPAGSTSSCNKFIASAVCSDYSIEFPVEGAATYSATFSNRAGSLAASSF